jgi:hypothetical protein
MTLQNRVATDSGRNSHEFLFALNSNQCFIYTPRLWREMRGGEGRCGRGIISAGMIGGNSEVLGGNFPLTGLDKTLVPIVFQQAEQ